MPFISLTFCFNSLRGKICFFATSLSLNKKQKPRKQSRRKVVLSSIDIHDTRCFCMCTSVCFFNFQMFWTCQFRTLKTEVYFFSNLKSVPLKISFSFCSSLCIFALLELGVPHMCRFDRGYKKELAAWELEQHVTLGHLFCVLGTILWCLQKQYMRVTLSHPFNPKYDSLKYHLRYQEAHKIPFVSIFLL